MNIWHALGLSGQKYICPIYPRPGKKPRFWRDSPAHVGVFSNAKDIIIPDPRSNPLVVHAPASGVIVELVQNHTQWGSTPYFLPFLNYVTVRTFVSGEFYQLCHIAVNSCIYKVGTAIEIGAVLAQTGVNGYMTDPRHIHFMVGVYTRKKKEGFVSVKVRWQKTPV